MKKSLVVLAFGTLGLGIAEFGMMSILSAAAEGLGISIAKAAFDIRLCAGRLFRCGGVGFSFAGKAAEDTADCVDGGDVRRQPAGGVCAKL